MLKALADRSRARRDDKDVDRSTIKRDRDDDLSPAEDEGKSSSDLGGTLHVDVLNSNSASDEKLQLDAIINVLSVRKACGGRFLVKSHILWAMYIKVMEWLKALLITSLTFSIFASFYLRRFGLVDVLSELTLLNRSYIALVAAKFICWAIGAYGIFAKKLWDASLAKDRLFEVVYGLVTSILVGKYAFPSLCCK